MTTNKVKAIKRPSKMELYNEQIKAAMPEVKALCKRHGRSTVRSCLERIYQYEKKAAQVEKLKAEAEELQRKLMADDGTLSAAR